jgi:hypothetical protein
MESTVTWNFLVHTWPSEGILLRPCIVPEEGREDGDGRSLSIEESGLFSHSTVLEDWGRTILEVSGGETARATMVDMARGTFHGVLGEEECVNLSAGEEGSLRGET